MAQTILSLELVHHNVYPIYELLQCARGRIVWKINNRISKTQNNSSISERNFGKGSSYEGVSKDLNQTNDSDEYLWVALPGQKGIYSMTHCSNQCHYDEWRGFEKMEELSRFWMFVCFCVLLIWGEILLIMREILRGEEQICWAWEVSRIGIHDIRFPKNLQRIML